MNKTLELPKSEPQVSDAIETSIHDCMTSATVAPRPRGEAMEAFSVRLPDGVKKQAMFLCERHCTDLGTYLRECTKALVKDYGGKLQELE